MIGKLKGIVDSVGEEEALIDVGGVGYLVHAGARTLARLTPGEAAILHIETYVREDQFKLFGFLDERDRAWFVRLQSVQGVGARHALALLDAASAGEVETATALGDASVFERARGIGKKLAQRIATELKDKAPPAQRAFAGGAGGLAADLDATHAGATRSAAPSGEAAVREAAVSALINLGYGESDARRTVAQVLRDQPEADEARLIRSALRELAR